MEMRATRTTRCQCSASRTEPSGPTCPRVARRSVHKLLDMAVKTRAMRGNWRRGRSLWEIRSSILNSEFPSHDGAAALEITSLLPGICGAADVDEIKIDAFDFGAAQ